MPVTIFFLRAVNLGGASAIKMEALKRIASAQGFRHATTLLQSGNLVAAHDGAPDAAAATLEKALAAEHPYRPRVIARRHEALRDAAAKSPLPLGETRRPNHLLLMPLDAEPAPDALARLKDKYAGPEEIALRGADLFLYYGDGIGRSKLTNALIEKQLGVQGTGRNWNTVAKLLELAQEIEARG